ncbi:MAG: hypothetical protein AAGI17_10360 [Planctomycetota bacterium]
MRSIQILLVLIAFTVQTVRVDAQPIYCGVDLSRYGSNIDIVPSGTNRVITSLEVVSGALVVEPGATINFGANGRLGIQDGASLILCGTPESPATLTGGIGAAGLSQVNDWRGVTLSDGAFMRSEHGLMVGASQPFVTGNGSRIVVELVDSRLLNGSGIGVQMLRGSVTAIRTVFSNWSGTGFDGPLSPVVVPTQGAILGFDDAEIVVDACVIERFTTRASRGFVGTGARGTQGPAFYGVYAQDAASVHVTNSYFGDLTGGPGGTGGQGRTGTAGANGDNPLIGGAQDGEPGEPGERGGIGGTGGVAAGIGAIGVADLVIAQNHFYNIDGGRGGSGGKGGTGGRGGRGADGGDGPIPGSGGDGGNGGSGGQGGDGGRSGAGHAFLVESPRGEHLIANNTARLIGGLSGGARGAGGNGGAGGSGGTGGDGPFGLMGSNGSNGSRGVSGPTGDFTGSTGRAYGLLLTDDQATLSPVTFANNIVAFGTASSRRGVDSTRDLDLQSLIVTNFTNTVVGPISGSPLVLSVDPMLDANKFNPTPLAGSPVIDAGVNAAVPFGLMGDVFGNPRFADDPNTADTGDNGGFPGLGTVDIGAVEFAGIVCTGADYNVDGRVDVLDVDDAISDSADALELIAILRAIDRGCP